MTLYDAIQWTAKEYVMREFVDKYRHSLPALCKATVGYDIGDADINQIGTGEIYWIYGMQKQKRLVAKASNGLYVSIPTDYPVKLLIVSNRNNPESLVTVNEAVERLQQGSTFRVMFDDNQPVFFSMGLEGGSKAQFGVMEVKDTYDQKYLLANSVIMDNISPRTVGLPVYLEVVFVVAEGFVHSENDDDFRNWFEDVKTVQKTFSRNPITTYNEVIVFDKCPANNDYEYISPYADLQMIISKQLYDNCTKSNHYVTRGHSGVKGQGAAAAPADRQTDMPSVAIPPPPHVVRAKQKKTPRHPPAASTLSGPPAPRSDFASLFGMPQNASASVASNVRKPRPAIPLLSDSRNPPPVPPPKQSRPQQSGNRLPPPPIPGIPCQPGQLAKSDFTVPQVPTGHRLPGMHPSQNRHSDVPRPPAHEPPVSRPPTLRQMSSPATTTSKWKTAAEVPTDVDISGWSKQDVADCLRLLRLDAYVENFQTDDVDGELLLTLDERMLAEHFGFNSFEARKLVNFAQQGWRPR